MRKYRAGATILFGLCILFFSTSTALALNTNTPALQVNIPGLKFTDIKTGAGDKGQAVIDVPWLAQYIEAIYKYATMIGVVVAAAIIIIGGFQYVTAGADASKVTAAKGRITNATIGLILVLSAFLLLYSVDPTLIVLKPIQVDVIKKENFSSLNFVEPVPTTEKSITEVPPPPGSPAGTKPTYTATSEVSGSAPAPSGCFRKTFGATDDEVAKQIVTVKWLGNSLFVHKLSAPDWQAAFKELEEAPADSPVGKWMTEIRAMPFYSGNCSGGSQQGGGYQKRIAKHDAKVEAKKEKNAELIAAGKPPNYVPGDSSDLHMFGLAIDIDSCRNPWVHNSQLVTKMPMELAALMAKHKLYWGGLGWKQGTTKLSNLWPHDPNFIGDHDAMHFEWHGACWP